MKEMESGKSNTTRKAGGGVLPDQCSKQYAGSGAASVWTKEPHSERGSGYHEGGYQEGGYREGGDGVMALARAFGRTVGY